MHHNLYNSLMLVTALNPYIGYENAAKRAGYKSMRQFYMAAIEDMIQKIDREFPE